MTRDTVRHLVLAALYRALSAYHTAQTRGDAAPVYFRGLPDQAWPDATRTLFQEETRAALHAHQHLGFTFTLTTHPGGCTYLLTPTGAAVHLPPGGLRALPGYPHLVTGTAVRITDHLIPDGDNHVGRTGLITQIVDDEAPLYVLLDPPGADGPVPFKAGEVQAITHRARLDQLARTAH